MRITCSRDVLQKGVTIVSKAVSSKTTMPILECILIHTEDNAIRMSANDTELGIETTLIGTISEPGSIAIDAKLFSEIVRRLPDNMVYIESTEQDIITIVCEKAHFSIPGKNPEEFVRMPKIEKTEGISLSQFTLKQIIQQTIFSVADNGNNPMMSGELLEVTGNILKLVSLDGHRISIRKVELKESYRSIRAVIPGKTLNEISKILGDSTDSSVLIYFTQNHVLFEFEETIVVSRLIEGEYFRIDQMLGGDYLTKLVVNKKDMNSCIDRAALLIRESDKKPIIINVTDESMEVRLNSPFGSMREELLIHKTGKDITIGFNPRFLADALRVIDDEEISIYMINAKAPCFIRNDEETYTYLILPVNFNVY